MNYTLEIKNLTKIYDGFNLDNVSFALPEGFIMGLIGPNGAGKTTIIKLIMNLIMKNSGSIKIFGKDHQKFEVEIKERIGFVYDNPNYYEHLNLQQIRGIVAPFYSRWDDGMFYKLVQKFDLPLNKKLKKYSRGMVMKAAIAIALSHNADIIIMDEPTSGLDPVFRREMLDLMFDILQNENKSILFSTHITSDLERIADYITFINKGKIIFSETKDEVIEKYSIVKGEKDFLNEETRGYFKGIRLGELGFEALTSQTEKLKSKKFANLLYDKATLEDIIYFHNKNLSDE